MEAERKAKAEQLKGEQRKQNPPSRKPFRLPAYVLAIPALAGVPIGLLWLVNLPYPPIREPIADEAPLLLLPSYIRFDNQYKGAINQIEQARQLIDGATSLADLRRGEEKLEQANKNLNGLPIWIESEWQDVAGIGGWYRLAYSPTGFNMARSEVGRLQAKIFQEKNAETTLLEAEKRIAAAKQQYATAQTLLARETAIAQWQNAIQQLSQIPPETLAGRLAQQKFDTAQEDLLSVVGQSSTIESQSEIFAAAEFAQRAAEASQNPPHPVEEWQQVESLWQEAIDRLRKVSDDDPVGYRQAQKKMAEYQTNLKQIGLRRIQEANSVRALQQAKDLANKLLASGVSDPRRVSAELQQIISTLKQVNQGTTVYTEAQDLLGKAQRKLSEVSAKAKN